jgi:hypothetical protein
VRISFKVKGTAVERYSVRPNRGLVQGKSSDKISRTANRFCVRACAAVARRVARTKN